MGNFAREGGRETLRFKPPSTSLYFPSLLHITGCRVRLLSLSRYLASLIAFCTLPSGEVSEEDRIGAEDRVARSTFFIPSSLVSFTPSSHFTLLSKPSQSSTSTFISSTSCYLPDTVPVPKPRLIPQTCQHVRPIRIRRHRCHPPVPSISTYISPQPGSSAYPPTRPHYRSIRPKRPYRPSTRRSRFESG